MSNSTRNLKISLGKNTKSTNIFKIEVIPPKTNNGQSLKNTLHKKSLSGLKKIDYQQQFRQYNQKNSNQSHQKLKINLSNQNRLMFKSSSKDKISKDRNKNIQQSFERIPSMMSYQMDRTMNLPQLPLSQLSSCQNKRLVKSARNKQRKRSWQLLKIKYPLLDIQNFMFEADNDPLKDINSQLKKQYVIFCTKSLKFKKLQMKDQQEVNFQPIRHPNIINISGRVIIKGKTFFVKDNKENFSLVQTINDYSLPYKQSYLKRRFEELVQAMIFLHQRNIIHNRILASKVYLEKQGNFLLDMLPATSNHLKQSEKVKHFYFLSPQMLLNNQVSFKNDVWGIGCLLLYLCTGNLQKSELHPYNQNYWKSHSVEDLRILRKLKPKYGGSSFEQHSPKFKGIINLSEQLKSFINNCLRINAKRRPQMIELNFKQFLQQ